MKVWRLGSCENFVLVLCHVTLKLADTSVVKSRPSGLIYGPKTQFWGLRVGCLYESYS